MPNELIPFVNLKAQYEELKPRILERINCVLEHGQYIMGQEVKELEEALANFVGVKHCISASSGTDTLLIALMALGVGSGDEVITTPFTFIATGEVIALLGAKPVFVDIDSKTYNIDPLKIESAITSRTKAILPVSIFGQCADMDSINEIASRFQLDVIEDAAQSFGATYKGRMSCGLSTIGSTSFFPSKPLGAYGDGGALFTNDDALAKLMREIRVHGQDRRYHHPRIGINGRIDTIQAAILLTKLERFTWEISQRKIIGDEYNRLIKQRCPNVVIPYIDPKCTCVYAQYTVQIDNREKIADSLKRQGIPTAVHYPIPLHLQPAFEQFGYKFGDFPVAEALSNRVLSIPMGPDLSFESMKFIIENISANLI